MEIEELKNVESVLASIMGCLLAIELTNDNIKEILDHTTENISNNQFIIKTNENKKFKVTVEEI